MSARDEVLARVRSATARRSRPGPDIARGYRTQTDEGIETFCDRLRHYGAQVRQVDKGELDDAVLAALDARGDRCVIGPDGVPDRWLSRVEALRDSPPLDASDLDRADGVITTCAVAIAQTGTIVLDGSTGMGRRALSLVPDHHLCIVGADQIVGSVPQALGRLDPRRALTFISGPSGTVDIEMIRVDGVHGPRHLEVLVSR